MPTPTKPTKRGQRTRRALLQAAWELMEEGGGAAVTMEDVAKRAGVSRRALYLHFGSRAELLMAVRAHVDEELDLDASLRPVVEAPDAVAALGAWARHVASYHGRIASVVRATDAARRTDPDLAAVWQAGMQAWYQACLKLTEWLAAEGRLAAPWTATTAADLLWALMSVELLQGLRQERGWSEAEYGERLFTVAARALTCDVRGGDCG